jgi:hypothetical protein
MLGGSNLERTLALPQQPRRIEEPAQLIESKFKISGRANEQYRVSIPDACAG